MAVIQEISVWRCLWALREDSRPAKLTAMEVVMMRRRWRTKSCDSSTADQVVAEDREHVACTDGELSLSVGVVGLVALAAAWQGVLHVLFWPLFRSQWNNYLVSRRGCIADDTTHRRSTLTWTTTRLQQRASEVEAKAEKRGGSHLIAARSAFLDGRLYSPPYLVGQWKEVAWRWRAADGGDRDGREPRWCVRCDGEVLAAFGGWRETDRGEVGPANHLTSPHPHIHTHAP